MNDSYIIAIIAALMIFVALTFFSHRRYLNLKEEKREIPWYILLGNYGYYVAVLFVIAGICSTTFGYYFYGQDFRF